MGRSIEALSRPIHLVAIATESARMARRLRVYLVDTNIWLERLLDQAGSEEVGQSLQRVWNDRLYLSDFTLHSIGIILLKLDEAATFAVLCKTF